MKSFPSITFRLSTIAALCDHRSRHLKGHSLFEGSMLDGDIIKIYWLMKNIFFSGITRPISIKLYLISDTW